MLNKLYECDCPYETYFNYVNLLSKFVSGLGLLCTKMTQIEIQGVITNQSCFGVIDSVILLNLK